MNSIYAMQRANGDWFAFDDHGRLHVPLFRSHRDAMVAHWRNSGMRLFKPMALDERALKDLAPTETESAAGFWLVTNPLANFKRGRPLEHAQLTMLVRDLAEQQTTPHPDTSPEISRLKPLPRNASRATDTWEDEGGKYSSQDLKR